MKQPAAELKTLDRIIPSELNERQQEFYRKLGNHLQKTANRNDTYELAEDGY
jgi:ABC-type nickel/cobalt efflux system permease component RcnA